jgi:hypothetical protein
LLRRLPRLVELDVPINAFTGTDGLTSKFTLKGFRQLKILWITSIRHSRLQTMAPDIQHLTPHLLRKRLDIVDKVDSALSTVFVSFECKETNEAEIDVVSEGCERWAEDNRPAMSSEWLHRLSLRQRTLSSAAATYRLSDKWEVMAESETEVYICVRGDRPWFKIVLPGKGKRRW